MALRWRVCLSAALTAMVSSAAFADALGGPAEPMGSADLGEGGGGANVKTISGVPSYIWYNGCGPTAAGMIVGYWDAHGFGNLIPGTNDWNTNQQAVKDMIASPGHIYDYVPSPDRTPTAEDPYHTSDCVADFNYCSRLPDKYGWSYYSYQDDGLRNYALYRGYAGSTANNVTYSSLWDDFVAAIDNNHPVELLVDTDGNGSTDHFVTAVGYDDTPGAYRYACFDTWYHTIRWESYRGLANGSPWGIHGGTFFNPVPEPTLLLPACLMILVLRRRKGRAG